MSSGRPGDEMPPELVEYLRGGRLVVAATIDADGFPYTMVMNSAVAVPVKDHVHLAGAGHAVVGVGPVD